MNSIHSHRYKRQLVLGIILPFLVIMNLGPIPTMAGRAEIPIPVLKSPSSESQAAGCSPSITFTHKPPVGSQEQILYGRVDCVNPADFKVAIYIDVTPGWYNKPSWDNPLTPINSNGTWQADLVTTAADHLAVTYAAFLLPNGVLATQRGGQPNLPDDMFTKSAAYLIEGRRTIDFSGYTWNVKGTAGEAKAGPGPNYFSASQNDVWVDGGGNLHLTISAKDGKWYSTEVYTKASLGYGTYMFTLASRVDQLDKNAVLGLFIWDDAELSPNHREIDIEFSKWGQDSGDNVQYVVQPYATPGNRHRFLMPLLDPFSTHSFKWEMNRILFTSHQGAIPGLGAQTQSWLYTGTDLPVVGMSNARINLWLYNGVPPSNGQRIEVVIESFQHPTVFSDLPISHWAWNFIQRLYDAAITGGCGAHPFKYCPESMVTRAQMAVFLERGINGSSYNPPAVGSNTGFADVPIDYWAGAWIKQLAAQGITGGCGTGTYCPEAPVTRAQMAVFLLRSKYGSSYSPPAVAGNTGFTDVSPTYWAGAWIKQLVAEGITAGCGTGTYCPETPVTRAQMAVFLVKTFNLP